MKRLLVYTGFICLTVFFLFALTSYVSSTETIPDPKFTWEGELNPNDFENWELISVQPISQGLFWVFVKNPDQASLIDIVVLVIGPDITLLEYRYLKNGKLFVYVLDSTKKKYVEFKLTKEQQRACIKCHRTRKGIQDHGLIETMWNG